MEETWLMLVRNKESSEMWLGRVPTHCPDIYNESQNTGSSHDRRTSILPHGKGSFF